MTRTLVITVLVSCLAGGCAPAPSGEAGKCRIYAPVPADGATGVSPDTALSWSADNCAARYRLYFGDTQPPPLVGEQTETIFSPGALDFGRTYYWKVDIIDGPAGPVWKFTTFWYGDPNAEEMDI